MPTSEIDNKKITRERDIIVDFIPAVLKKTKSEGYLIEYHYKDKITNKLVRKRYYLNRVVNAYQKKSDGVNHARRIVHELNEKLKNGWTPIFETENQRLYTPILQLRDIYLNNKKRDLRADTMRSYTSMTNLFNEWTEGSNRSGKVTGNFLRYDAICYMDYVYDKGFSNRLVYNSAMRPKEITNIQIKDIRLNDRYIIVREDNAKNGKARCATITAEVIEYLRPLIENLPDNHFLFGMNKDLLPDDKRCALSKFRKLWDDMRTKLKLPQEMQLYSLRDTGMIDLLHAGVDELSVQHHYDHSNLTIQAIYTNHHDPNLNERIFMNAPKF